VGLAARGSRKLGDKSERIQHADELAQVRRQAAGVWRKSVIAGGLMTLVVVLAG
jgi:hypothetical protein